MEIENQSTLNAQTANAVKGWTRAAWFSIGLYGWAAVLSGAVLPQVAETFHLSPALAGLFVAIPSVGFTLAGLAGGLISERIGLQRLLAFSAIGITLGLGLVALAQWMTVLLTGALVVGLAGGVLEIGSNGLVTSFYHPEAAPHVNRLHIFYGLGSFICPLIVGLLFEQGANWRIDFGLACALSLGLAIALFELPKTKTAGLSRVDLSQYVRLLGRPSVLRAAVGSLLFVAAEIGLSSWLVTYLQSDKKITPLIASASLSVFWLAIIAGRYLNSRLPGNTNLKNVVLIEAAGSGIATIGILLSTHPVFILLALIITGLMMAGIVPTLLAYACHDSTDNIGSISGITLAATGVGLLIGPGAIGVIAEYVGLNDALYLVAGLLIIVVLLFL